MAGDIKAYRTSAVGVTSIVFSRSRGKARHATLLSARDAGYRLGFTEVSAYRAPEYDCRLTIHDNVPALNTPLEPYRLRRT